MDSKRNIILDVDTGTDDAVAILMAALRPEIALKACTTVWGNHGVEKTTQNTLDVLSHIGASEVPVYQGRSGPIMVTPRAARQRIGGSQGMHPEELGFEEGVATAANGDAPHKIVEIVRTSESPVSIVAVAPLTNIAAAVLIDPGFATQVDELIVMGGANEFGNVTPSAEANFWHDPHAAEIVLHAGFPHVTLVPLDATHDALITADQVEELASLQTPAGVAAARLIHQRIKAHDASQPQQIPHSAAVHDALCIAYLLEPKVIQIEDMFVSVETSGFNTFGRSVMDVRARSGEPPNARVALNADRHVFFDCIKASLSITT